MMRLQWYYGIVLTVSKTERRANRCVTGWQQLKWKGITEWMGLLSSSIDCLNTEDEMLVEHTDGHSS